MSGAIAIVGATGGLGEAVARRLTARAPVLLGYHRNATRARALAEEIEAAGGRAAAACIDLRDPGSIDAFFTDARDSVGELAHVVSATGPAIPLCPLLEVGEAEFRRILETDVIGSFNLLRHAVPMLAGTGGGSITLFVTTAVLRTLENDGMSSIPKTAVAGMVRLAAREAGPHNVRCNAVAPGVIDAGIVHSSFVVSQVAKDVIANCMARTPAARMGRPGEVAALVDFLCSDDAAYVNGQVIGIDGGYSA